MDRQSGSMFSNKQIGLNQPQAGPSRSTAPGIEEFDVKNVRVLVVEDDTTTLSSIIRLLQMHFNYVHGVATGEEALAVVRSYPDIDIILLDVHLPGMQGISLLEILTRESDVPVVLISVDEDIQTIRSGISLGAVDYIIKPVSAKSLKLIWQHVYRRRLQKQETPRAPRVQRMEWTQQLHELFVNAVHRLGVKNAVPKSIKRMMGIPSLTREQIASHLQKYRNQIKLQSKDDRTVLQQDALALGPPSVLEPEPGQWKGLTFMPDEGRFELDAQGFEFGRSEGAEAGPSTRSGQRGANKRGSSVRDATEEDNKGDKGKKKKKRVTRE